MQAPFNPYAPPQAPPAGAPYGMPALPPRVQGSLLTVGKTYFFPPLCVKCGAESELRGRAEKFAWIPPWTYAVLLAGPLPMFIVQAIVTKRALLQLPLCPTCSSRWTAARWSRTLGVVVPVIGGLSLAGVAAAYGWNALLGLGALLFFPGILVLIPIEWLLVRPRTLKATYADDHVITLKGVAPRVLELLSRG